MQPLRKADCPNCGGPIEFALGSSAAAVCPYCRFSVVRKGLALEAIGKLAELVPTAAVMAVGDSGEIGGRRFVVGGRMQLDHGQGPWDEWYVELDGGRWGWLAKAQGRWYLTHPIERPEVPAWETLTPGQRISLPAAGNTPLTVAERGSSTLVSAEGELPFAAVPGLSGRYADLSGDAGIFATIDYGDGSEPPTLFVGREVPAHEIRIRETALGPRPEERADAERLRCPTCGAPVEIRAPELTERAACGSCRSLLDYSGGALAYVERLEQSRIEPRVPLGTSGTLRGEKVLVIGYLERSTTFDGTVYGWSEYLLHTDAGYRWLTEDAGHFVYMRPLPPGEVRDGVGTVYHRGKRYKAFQSSIGEVRTVLGELYWKVEAGERAELADFVAPPHLLSRERTDREVSWSLGEYVDGTEVWQGLGLPGRPPPARGVAPSQPNPVDLGWAAAVGALLVLALVVLAFVFEWTGSERVVAPLRLKLRDAAAQTQGPEASIVYSEPFDIPRGPTTLQVRLVTNLSNAWLAVAAALVDESTGKVRQFYVQAEEWHGISGGERWHEGDTTPVEYVGRVSPGRYVMRFDTQWGREGGVMRGPTPGATVEVVEGKRSPGCCIGAGFLLLLPLFVLAVRKSTFEARRWSQSDMASAFDTE